MSFLGNKNAVSRNSNNKLVITNPYFFFLFQGNAIYNILPDVISRLSDPDCGIEEEPFRNIMRYKCDIFGGNLYQKR